LKLYSFTVSFSKYALQQFVENTEQDRNLKAGGDAPALEAQLEGEGAIVLVLYVPVMGMHVEFTFRFLPVALETAAIFETQLRDAEEEIERLKGEITKLKEAQIHCIVLRSENKVGNYPVVEVIRWNLFIHNTSRAIFQVSPDQQQVRILSDGLYQVSCRYLAPDGNPGTLNVSINENMIASACCGIINSTLSICDIVPLKENDVLSVTYISGNRRDSGGREHNQLSITKLV
jgi:hypothetical protein